MIFCKRPSLQAEYDLARTNRGKGIIIGFFVGIVIGGILYQDISFALLSGLLIAIVIGVWKSTEVEHLKRIIYPGGKR